MQSLTIDPDQHYCRCGALCDKTSTLCQKCRDRCRWYRRKAWRVNPTRHIDPAGTITKEVITR